MVVGIARRVSASAAKIIASVEKAAGVRSVRGVRSFRDYAHAREKKKKIIARA